MANEPSFKRRFDVMGDWSEEVFRAWAAHKNVIAEEWGLKRPAFKSFRKIPALIRHQPDYLCESPKKTHFFVEVKGCGRDQIIKIKVEDVQLLNETCRFYELPAFFFVYDMTNKRVALFDAQLLIDADKSKLNMGTFPDGNKPYYAIPTNSPWLVWEDITWKME